MSDLTRPSRIRWRGQITGPYPLDVILRRLDDNELSVWHEVEYAGEWMKLEDLLSRLEDDRRVRDAANSAPPTTAAPPSPPPVLSLPFTVPGTPGSAGSATEPPLPESQSSRKRSLFVIAGILLGFTGVHNFYAGYWGTGAVQLGLLVTLSFLGFGIVIPWVWALVEVIVVQTDPRGVPMS